MASITITQAREFVHAFQEIRRGNSECTKTIHGTQGLTLNVQRSSLGDIFVSMHCTSVGIDYQFWNVYDIDILKCTRMAIYGDGCPFDVKIRGE